MVDHKTPVLLLICLTTMLMISGCAVTKAGVDVVFKPNYLTSENSIPLVGESLNKDLTVRLIYPYAPIYDIDNITEFKEFLNNLLKKELELVFNSVQLWDHESNYDLYVRPTVIRKYGADHLTLSLPFGVNGFGLLPKVEFSTSIKGSTHYITTNYRNFSTELSEAARVLMNQIVAYGDIQAELKPVLVKQEKANKKAAEDTKRRAAAQAKARAIRAPKDRDEAIRQAKIKKAAAVKQARANKEKLMSTRKLAERGDVNAQYNLGMIYHKGLLGISQDDKEAVKWLMKAAVQGDNEAQDELAYISPGAVDEVIRIQTMNKAKAQCTELGLTLGTDKHADCAVRMFSTARADQRMKEQLKAKRAETDRLIRQSKLNQADSDRRNQEQVRLQRAALKAQKRQRDREVSLRMLRQGLEMMQGPPAPVNQNIHCSSQPDGAGGVITNCQ